MKQAVGLVLERGGVREFPFIWFWPDGAPGCVMMTHDVEGAGGAGFCGELMDLDDELRHQVVVPGRARRPVVVEGRPRSSWLSKLKRRGFEVNVHDLTHDGHLFRDRERFLRHAAEINARGREFGSRGFRSGAMYRRQDWFSALDISYDMSVPNVAHLEPQRGGCCTVMPFFMGHVLELPLTAAQDYTLFHVLGDYSTRLWQEQIDRILERERARQLHRAPRLPDRAARAGGLHRAAAPPGRAPRRAPASGSRCPSEIDQWWRNRREMRLVPDGESWRIEGPGSERARVAYARLEGGSRRLRGSVDRRRPRPS